MCDQNDPGVEGLLEKCPVDFKVSADVLLEQKLETPEGTSNVCRYASAYIRDLNREEYNNSNSTLKRVSRVLDAASKHLRKEDD